MKVLRFVLLLPVFIVFWILALFTWTTCVFLFIIILFLSSLGYDASNVDWPFGSPRSHFDAFVKYSRRGINWFSTHAKNFFG